MSEQQQDQTSSQEKEVQMEELFSVLRNGVRQGVDGVLGGIGGFAKYSVLGVKYASGDIKQLSLKALEKGKAMADANKAEATA